MGVAAQWMAYQRRMGHRPGPLGAIAAPSAGSGEQPTGIPQVELYLGGWVDVTALGLVRYQQSIHITRGQPDENQRTNPSTATFRLANLDGRFSPRNPLGLYFGQIDRNTPCRISVQSGNTKSYRFWGEVSSWPQSWDKTGNDAWVDVQAAGILRRLGTGVNPLQSPIYLMWANATGSNAAAAYWPMEDAVGATQFASGIGGTSLQIAGKPTLANNSSFIVSNPLPTLNGATFLGRVPRYTPTPDFVGNLNNDIECLLQVPSGGETTGSLVMSFTMTGAIPTWEVYYSNTSGGQVGLRGRNGAGTVVLDTGLLTGIAVNGLVGQLSVVVTQNGTETDGTVGVFDPFSAVRNSAFGSASSTTCGIMSSVKVNPNGGLSSTTIGHLSVSGFAVSSGFTAYNGYTGEAAGSRFQRLCAAANVNSELVYNLNTGSPGTAMGPQHPGNLLDLLQECADVDGGIIFETLDQLGLGYRTRDDIENQTGAVLALDYEQAQLSDVPSPVDDDTYTRNDITVTRLGGSFTRAIQSSGPLNNQNPPAGVGTYSTSITLNLQTDTQTVDEAGRLLHLGTVAEPRYPDVGMQLARAAITSSPVLRPNALALMPGDRLTVANPPTWLPPDTISALVLGYTETFDQFLHAIKWNTRPESAFRVAVADDALYGHADTDGTTLAASVTATATSLSLATTNAASPKWTTKLSDYPFDLSLGGERVTAVSPGTNLTTDPLMLNGVTNWSGMNCTIAADGTYQYLPGQIPILVTPNAGAASGSLIAAASTGVGSITPTATYRLACWAYCPQGWTDVRVCVDWYDNTGVFLSTSLGSASTIAAATWTFLTQDLAAPASASQAFPRFRWGSTPGSGVYFWAYDLTMVPVSTITGVSPQPLTVIRSVNGVVKPQVQGTGVQLYQPAILTIL